MAISDLLTQELDQEAQTTRRVLERVPDDKLAWKPHDKSMSLGQLALHVATVPGNVAQMAMQSSVQIPDFTQPAAATAAELVPTLEESVATAKGILANLDDEGMAGIWTAQAGDREVMSVPRGVVFRSILFNHWYHHRSQLSVYLRLLDIPVPSIYGPSADDNPFA